MYQYDPSADPEIVFLDYPDLPSQDSRYYCSDLDRCDRGDACDGDHTYSDWHYTERWDLGEPSTESPLLKSKMAVDESEVDQPLLKSKISGVKCVDPTPMVTSDEGVPGAKCADPVGDDGSSSSEIGEFVPDSKDVQDNKWPYVVGEGVCSTECGDIAPDSEDGKSES